MRVVTQCVIKGTLEAAETYKLAFGLTDGLTVKHDDGTYAHLSLMSGDLEILSMTESSDEASGENKNQSSSTVSGIANIGLYGLTKEEVLKAYDVLKKDAIKVTDEPKSAPRLELYFILIDKYGVGWQIGT